MKSLVHEKMTNRAALLYGVLGVTEYMPQGVVLNAANVANRIHETLFVFKIRTSRLLALCL
jgi:hypothetical protein